MPVLVVCGDKDQDNGSAEELVAALPDARLRTIPGTHMSSVTEPEPGEAIAAFLPACPCGAPAPSWGQPAAESAPHTQGTAPHETHEHARVAVSFAYPQNGRTPCQEKSGQTR